jgi:hypothetical protein
MGSDQVAGADVVVTVDFGVTARFTFTPVVLDAVAAAEPVSDGSPVDSLVAGSAIEVCSAATTAPGSGAGGGEPAENVR